MSKHFWVFNDVLGFFEGFVSFLMLCTCFYFQSGTALLNKKFDLELNKISFCSDRVLLNVLVFYWLQVLMLYYDRVKWKCSDVKELSVLNR